MKVVIIGSGNVATVLGKKIFLCGHEILQVVSRSIKHADTLALQLNTTAADNLATISTDADIYLICVGDNSIKLVAEHICVQDKIIAHTAGAINKNVLQSSNKYGVLYPLQSLRKEVRQLPEIPVMVDGNIPQVCSTLYDFASGWASSVSFATDEERLKLHVAAVIASNFSNHLYTLTEEFCKREGLSFAHLIPLIKETSARLSHASPSGLQTGPASRNDTSTIDKHLQILEPYPHLSQLYRHLSESIAQYSTILPK